MPIFFSLEIGFNNQEEIDKIANILGVQPNNRKYSWKYEFELSEDEPHTYYFEYFLKILEGHYDELLKIGIKRKDILIWYLYAYDQECIIEFEPEIIHELGKQGIKLCISCWKKDSYIYF